MELHIPGLFLYRDAARCFKKAYDYNNNPACMREMEEAWRMAAPDEKEQIYEVSEELQKTLEDIHKQWNDEEEVLEAFRDVLDKKKYIYESNGRWA